MSLCIEILITIGYTSASTSKGRNYLSHFTDTLPEIGYKITLLLITNPNRFHFESMLIIFLSCSSLEIFKMV